MSEPMRSSPTILTSQGPGPERRLAVRYSCTLKTLCQTKTARPEDFWWWGKVRDISSSGISLVIRRPFEPGTQLIIEPLTGRDSIQTLLARVIRATKNARGGWLLGCEFAGLSADPSRVTSQIEAAMRSSAADRIPVT
jgi:hypothetical protein